MPLGLSNESSVPAGSAAKAASVGAGELTVIVQVCEHHHGRADVTNRNVLLQREISKLTKNCERAWTREGINQTRRSEGCNQCFEFWFGPDCDFYYGLRRKQVGSTKVPFLLSTILHLFVVPSDDSEWYDYHSKDSNEDFGSS
jgi:hypothetical protein